MRMKYYICLVVLTIWRQVDLKVLPGRGTFLINGIFPITSRHNINYQSGVMMAEAMKYAVGKVQRRKNYLYGYKLSIKDIIDTVDDDIVRKCILDTFTDEVPFLIGPYSSETSYIGSILTRTFGQLAVTYSATYTDFEKTQGYMLRTVPTDKYRVAAALDVVKKLDWNYIGVISSYGYNGEREALRFIQKLSMIGVCLANLIDLPQREQEQRSMEAIAAMNEDKQLKALVLFTTRSDSRLLFSAIHRLGLRGRFYILCIYGCTNYVEVVTGLEGEANGVLSLDIHYPEDKGFKDYFLKLKPTHHSPRYLLYFWENIFNCTLDINENEMFQPEISCTAEAAHRGKSLKSTTKCTGLEKLGVEHGYYPLTPVHSVINGVYAIADVISDMIKRVCNEDNLKRVNRTSCYIDVATHYEQMTRYLVKTFPKYVDGTIKFNNDNNGNSTVRYDIHHYQNMRSKLVGTWSINRDDSQIVPKANFNMQEIWTLLSNGTLMLTSAHCSSECPFGHIKIPDTNIIKEMCCWTCRKCPRQNIAVNGSCVRCRHTERADLASTSCTPLPRKYISLKQTTSWVIFVLCCVGCSSVLFVGGTFLKWGSHGVVTSSGRDLCFLILLGILLSFATPLLFLIKPTSCTCLFRGALPGIAFTACYAPLFLRTNRIYRVFFHSKLSSVPRPSLGNSQSQFLVSCGIIAIQMLLVGVWFVSKVPSPEETVAVNRSYVNLHCKADTSPILLLLNLSLSMIFMISCTILAFKTRHFPKNHNEAKHIGLTLYLSCVSWAVFFPAYFLTNPKTEFLREYLMCAICLLIGYTTLVGLFAPKIRMVICRPANKGEEKVIKEVNGSGKWNLSENDESKRREKRNSEPVTDISNAASPTHQALLT